MRASTVVAVALVLSAATAMVAAYDREQVLRYLEYASAAFCEEEEMQFWPRCTASGGCMIGRTEGFNLTAVVHGRRTGTNAYIGYNERDKIIVAAWRGTDNGRNVFQDLRFRLTPYDGEGAPADAHVHRGFLDCYRETDNITVSHVRELLARFPTFSVVTVGHSLGGAIAAHAALDLNLNGINATAYTFGAPRVGNAEFAAFYQEKVPSHLRTVAYNDMFPHLPPPAFDYHHAPQELWVLEDRSTIVECDMSGEDPACANSIPPKSLSGEAHLYYFHITFGACYLSELAA